MYIIYRNEVNVIGLKGNVFLYQISYFICEYINYLVYNRILNLYFNEYLLINSHIKYIINSQLSLLTIYNRLNSISKF